jgi:hypothetical protein
MDSHQNPRWQVKVAFCCFKKNHSQVEAIHKLKKLVMNFFAKFFKEKLFTN